MENLNTLKASKFIKWYFSDESDYKDLGRDIAHELRASGYYNITIKSLFDTCGYIPGYICESPVDDVDFEPEDIIFIDDITQEKECQKCHHKYTQNPDYCPNCGTCAN